VTQSGSGGVEIVNSDSEEPEGPPAVDGTLAKSTSGEMIPWDERIHSKGQSINADGSWRLKRGVDDSVVKQIEAELAAPTETAAPGVQSESKSEATPPPGAAEAMLAPPPAPAPALNLADFSYKHGDQVFTYDQLKSAQWTDEQIKALERVPAAAPSPVTSESAAPAKALTFAELAMQINAKGLSWDTVNAEIVKIATAKGKPHVAQFALLAIPENADILADLAAAIL